MLNIICCYQGHVGSESNDGLPDATDWPKTNLVNIQFRGVNSWKKACDDSG